MDADIPSPPPVPPAPLRGPHPSAVLRTVAWRGRDDVSLVTVRPGSPPPAPGEIAALVDRSTRAGVRRLVTGALTDVEQEPFAQAGFTVHDRLHLLRHDLVDLPAVDSPVRLRRARRLDVEAALAVDARAFEPFWRLDRGGLDDALAATAAARFRVADDGGVVGYAVTGRSAARGYLQRLAVDPERWRQGVGAALVVDGLRWLRRRHVRVAVVNTQVGNDGAYALYRRMGFVPEPRGLTVLTLALAP
ncbi:MAG TPA: GNAT family N-acetyltransferase [Iamia sp.]